MPDLIEPAGGEGVSSPTEGQQPAPPAAEHATAAAPPGALSQPPAGPPPAEPAGTPTHAPAGSAELYRQSPWLDTLRQSAVSARLASSDLPPAVRRRLARGRYDEPEELEAAITEAREELAQLASKADRAPLAA